MRQKPGPSQDQGGFAAVDALVAVTILSSSLALSLTAAEIGLRASRTAAETRDAEMILRGGLESTAGQAGAWSGRALGMAWRVEAHFTDAAFLRRGGPCARTASAKATGSGRTYRMTTMDACLPEGGA
ncbi:hypothetical protein [Caulobacter sp. LARHSG274]